jgi:hypothetical protein
MPGAMEFVTPWDVIEVISVPNESGRPIVKVAGVVPDVRMIVVDVNATGAETRRVVDRSRCGGVKPGLIDGT